MYGNAEGIRILKKYSRSYALIKKLIHEYSAAPALIRLSTM
jgi:hypothetical protein